MMYRADGRVGAQDVVASGPRARAPPRPRRTTSRVCRLPENEGQGGAVPRLTLQVYLLVIVQSRDGVGIRCSSMVVVAKCIEESTLVQVPRVEIGVFGHKSSLSIRTSIPRAREAPQGLFFS